MGGCIISLLKQFIMVLRLEKGELILSLYLDMKLPLIKLIECPRDAMQGIKTFIPTDKKVAFINSLLKVGFDTIDAGSFVSPSVIPQMADTIKVLEQLDTDHSRTKLLTIIPNVQGGIKAASLKQVHYLGYPFSISETFQLRNTNKTILQSIDIVKELLDISAARNKELVVYLSMGFGNPYGDLYSKEVVYDWSAKLVDLGVKIISLSDTIGVATPAQISDLFGYLIQTFDTVEIGAHLHTNANSWEEKMTAAYQAGCYRYDGAIKGYGGCPMAKDEMIGNMPTEQLISYFGPTQLGEAFNFMAFQEAYALASETFPL